MSDRVTVSIIKADVGSVCGHSRPHPKMMESCREVLRDGLRAGTVNDFYVTRVGDDINLFMTHNRGENSKDVHGLAWEAFKAATKLAKEMKMYAAGQDILKDAFSGNVRGMGPGSAEMEFKERGAEPLIFFMADKTEPSAYSMPLSRVFMDPYTTTGLVIDPRAHVGFKFEIVDVIDSKKIVMSAPEESYDILSLLGDTTRYAIKRIWSKHDDIGIGAVISTDKLNLTAGKYVGKDDPVAIVRCQSGLPAVGEVLQPFMFPQLVAGWMRGSHYGAWFPCSVDNSDPTFFDGPPRVCALGMMISNGKFQGCEDPVHDVGVHRPIDFFAGSEWDGARAKAMKASIYMRQHGPFMPGILGPEEMEYTTRPAVLCKLKDRMENID
ncbi:MAG: fructose-1,6-bisphosphatase [Euryarchaeota archaeon]|nr:fructose-1,6-bisphosphatase [Euryarchaeota archaeon]